MKIPFVRRQRTGAESALALGSACYFQFRTTGEAERLDKAIHYLKIAIYLTGDNDPERFRRLHTLAVATAARYQVNTSPGDLDAMISYQRAALAAGTPDKGLRAAVLTNLGTALHWRHDTADAQPADLDEAVDSTREAAGLLADDPANLAVTLANLSSALLARHRRLDRPADLDDALAVAERSARLPNVSDAAQAVLYANLAAIRRDRYWRDRDPADLDAAVDAAERAARALPDKDPRRADAYAGLRGSAIDRFDLAGRSEDLELAIEAGRTALAAAPASGRGPYLFALGRFLLDQYRLSGSPANAAEAAELLAAALAVTDPPPSPYVVAYGEARRMATGSTGDLGYLDAALDAVHRAARQAPPGHPDHVERAVQLGAILVEQFHQTRRRESIDEAVAVFREVHGSDDLSSAQQPAVQADLSNTLRELSTVTGDVATLTEAVTLGREAVAADPANGAFADNLVLALRDLYQVTADPLILPEAVELSRQALATLLPHHPQHAERLDNLRESLWMLYQNTGDAQILAEAERIGRDAVRGQGHGADRQYMDELGPAVEASSGPAVARELLEAAARRAAEEIAATPGGHPLRPQRLARLGYLQQRIFDLTDREDALRAAEDAFRQALGAVSEDYGHYATRMHDLAVILLMRLLRIDDPALLDEAVDLLRRTVDHLGPENRDYPSALADLGRTLRLRYQRTGDPAALLEAVDVGRRAVAAYPPGGRDIAVAFLHLGLSLSDLGRAVDESDRAMVAGEWVDVARHVLDGMPVGHPDRHFLVGALGDALMFRFYYVDQDDATMREMVRCFAEAGADPAEPLRMRVLHLQLVAVFSAEEPIADPAAALAAIEDVIALLPRIAPRHLLRVDRERGLARISTLPTDAVTAALAVGRPERAVQLLEASRGVLVADVVDARSSDLDALRALDGGAELADTFERLRDRIDSLDTALAQPSAPTYSDEAGESGPPPAWTAATDLAVDRRQAYEEWDALLERIHADPRTAGFLRPPTVEWLSAQADAGQIVFVTSDEQCGNALILRAGRPVTAIPLPGLATEHVDQQGERFNQAVARTRDIHVAERPDDPAAAIDDVLAWLWDAVAEPVLVELGHQGPPAAGEPWPRIWWCPVGRVAGLPLHAAGHHGPDGRSVLDRVVSSYTATVRTLAYARRAISGGDAATIVIAEPGGGDMPYLPGAEAEGREVTALIPGAQLLEHPDRAAVLAALPAAAVAHFACHGLADRLDPGESRLVLRDHRRSPLTVREVSRLRLADARLAYLSACATTVTSSDLADEAVHVTGAFQLAGYQQVIGTLWPIDDTVAQDVARLVYRYLTDGGTSAPDTARAAEALHHAIRATRTARPHDAASWSAYLHMGT
jgi:tetratricopeptide (TPR) repeat protein